MKRRDFIKGLAATPAIAIAIAVVGVPEAKPSMDIDEFSRKYIQPAAASMGRVDSFRYIESNNDFSGRAIVALNKYHHSI